MSKIVFSSLKTAVKGTALLFASSVLSLLFWFGIKVYIIRNVTQAEFGIYSLALTVLAVLTVLSSLGLMEGSTRQISVTRGRGETGKLDGIIKSAIEVAIISSAIAAIGLYFFSGTLAERVFDMPSLTLPLKLISVAMVLSVSLNLLVTIFRGFGNMHVKAVNDVMVPVVFLILLTLVFTFKLPFLAVIGAYIAAHALVLIWISIYSNRKLELLRILFRRAETCRRELLIFSVPLLGVTLTGMIMTWTDTLMLGYFMRAEDVGVYNVGVSLARLLMFAVTILGFVFMPLAGELYARGQMDDLKRTYQVITKWVFMAAFPVFLVLFFFPEMTLTFLFGAQYEAASNVLKILSVRFMLALFVGMSGVMLTVLGMTHVIMWTTMIGAAINVVLNYKLIPLYGITGAASATLISAAFPILLNLFFIFHKSRIHPFTLRYLKPIASSALIAFVIYVIAKSIPLYFWMLTIYFIFFIGGYLMAILLTRSIEKEDVAMFEVVSGKIGLELKSIIRILNRFTYE